jgi:hypothetical protein
MRHAGVVKAIIPKKKYDLKISCVSVFGKLISKHRVESGN